MSGIPLYFPRFRAINQAGNAPLAGGKVYVYLAGTLTQTPSYTTAALSVANANPVILDANGEADIFLPTGSYKIILQDASSVQQWSDDNIVILAASGSFSVAQNEWVTIPSVPTYSSATT